MKTTAYVFNGLIFLLLAATTGCSSTQQLTGSSGIDSLLPGTRWVFEASQLNPTYGRSRFLEAGYTIKHTGEQLVVSLPYTGRSYTGMDAYAANGPLTFTTNRFTIKISEEKKQRKMLLIEVKEAGDVRDFRLLVFPDGTASLDVQFNNHSPVSFRGKLKPD